MIINNLQAKRLESLFKYLNNNNFYWNKKLSVAGFDKLRNIKDVFYKLEITTKKEILENFHSYLDVSFTSLVRNEDLLEDVSNISKLTKNHDRFLHNGYVVEMTSGTTGIPFPIIKSQNERFIAANQLLHQRKGHYSGANIKNGFLLAHEVDEKLKNINFYDENYDMSEIVNYFILKKPKWMFVTANTLRRFVNTVNVNGYYENVHNIGVEFIEVTSAPLSFSEKKDMESMFNSKIVNQYGCREVWNIAYECKCGKMHINDNVIVELVDEHGNFINEDNKVGEVVITSLVNKTTPIIRYYLGDLARINSEKCECGLKTPVISLAGGRKSEILKNTNYFGSQVFRKVLRALNFSKGVKYDKIKIVQDGEFHITIYIKECNDNLNFEKAFINVANTLIENFEQFNINFIYNYPFKNEKNFLKEQLFICKI